MIIAATSTFPLGPFTVHVRPRFDSPAWAVYIILRGQRLIGKQFSRPNLDDCRWLEQQSRLERLQYASRPCHRFVYSIRIGKSATNPRATARNAVPKREPELA